MPSIHYRPEIDGLRALSVLGVVLFHAGLGIPGGYVGVDVFFVISGYLITSIILKDIKEGTFTFSGFWARRIRRILPAVSVMAFACLIAGYFFLIPTSYFDFSRSSFAQSLMLSNIYFGRNTGYFSEVAEYQPLLHTWSLAVEEQFYFIFPLVIVLLCRFFKKQVLWIVAAAACLSLIWSIYVIQHDHASAFFLLPARAWELLAGAAIAASQHRFILSRRTAEISSFAGLALIFMAMFLYDTDTVFPGITALLPVTGAVIFIAGCKDRKTVASRLLSVKPIVFLGLTSYSLYLWHWPLFSFARHLLIDIDTPTRLTLVLASLLLGVLSWKFVENPFRKGTLLTRPSSAFKFGFATLSLLVVSSLGIRMLDGVPDRYDPNEFLIIEDISWQDRQYMVTDAAPKFIGASNPDGDGSTPDFVLWGDSHAASMAKTINRLAEERDMVGEAYLTNGSIPIPGLWVPSWSDSRNRRDHVRNSEILQSIVDRKIPNLILVVRWSLYTGGRSPLEIRCNRALYETMVTDHEVDTVTPEIAAASVHRQLEAMIEQLSDSGTRVWLIRQVPETTDVDMGLHFYLAQYFPALNHLDIVPVNMDDHQHRRRHADAAFKDLDSPWLTFIDPAPRFFDNKRAELEVYAERSYYKDDNHLTRYGVEEFLAPVFQDLFADMKRNKTRIVGVN